MLLIYSGDKKSRFLRWAAADLSQRFFSAHSLANHQKQPALYSQALAVSCALIRCKSALILRALKISVKTFRASPSFSIFRRCSSEKQLRSLLDQRANGVHAVVKTDGIHRCSLFFRHGGVRINAVHEREERIRKRAARSSVELWAQLSPKARRRTQTNGRTCA